MVLSIFAALLSFGGVASADTWSGEWRIQVDGLREVTRNPPTTDRVEPDALIAMMFSLGELRLRVAEGSSVRMALVDKGTGAAVGDQDIPSLSVQF